MKRMTLLFALIFIVTACSHADTATISGKEHHSAENMDTTQLDAHTKLLGHQEVNGVRAVAQLKDVRKAMSDAGMTTTHHFMVVMHDQSQILTLIKGPSR